MKNSKILWIASMFLSFKTVAQNGYDIVINTKNAKDKIIQLSYYRGSAIKPDLVDSIAITKVQQLVEFKTSKKIIGGIYCINFKGSDKNNTTDIAIDNTTKLQFELSDTTLSKMTATDKMHQAFFQYQNIIPGADITEKRELLNLLTKNYPQSVVSLYAKIELKKIDVFGKKQDSSNRKLRDEYFNGIDLLDKRIQLLPNTYSFLYNYFSLLPFNNDNYKNDVDLLLKGMDCSTKNYIFYLSWIFKNFRYLERYNLNDTYRYVYSTYLDKEPCKSDNQSFYYRITAEYKELDALIIGNTIPDFEMQDSLNTIYTIKNILAKSKYTFLAFFDPDCSHCQEILPIISKYFDSVNYDKYLIQTVSFANATDLRDWQAFLKNSKLQNWLNVKPNAGDQKYQIELKVYTNPCFFLIDDKGIIRLKNFNKARIDKIIHGRD